MHIVIVSQWSNNFEKRYYLRQEAIANCDQRNFFKVSEFYEAYV